MFHAVCARLLGTEKQICDDMCAAPELSTDISARIAQPAPRKAARPSSAMGAKAWTAAEKQRQATAQAEVEAGVAHLLSTSDTSSYAMRCDADSVHS